MAAEDVERVWLVLDALAAEHPAMPLKDGVILAQRVHREVDWMRAQGISDPPVDEGRLPPHSWDPQVLGAWGGRQPEVLAFLPDKKINAIKELRSRSGAGLKEAKEAVEWLVANDLRFRART